jgi:hypothetical protein
MTMRSYLSAAIAAALLLVGPARAEDKVPTVQYQEILIKTSLLTLNDADLTGNYAVLHAKLSKPFRDQFSPDQLKNSFKPLADQKADLALIAGMPPIATSEAAIDGRGALILRGYFDTKPSRLNYELDFLPSEGQWKPLKLFVDLKAEKQN